jgi:hypothetical protein
MPKKSTPPKRKDVAEQPASGGRRPSACSLLGDVIEAPGPYDVVRAHNSELWLVVDAHRDAILWTEQQLAADAAAEALNGMARLKALHDCMGPNGFFARKIEKILSPENELSAPAAGSGESTSTHQSK